ncbi:MAG TPA: DNA repair protein RadC [Thermotogota bacterium]|jgi:DNA repair protein RadC|nr:DNA repair protein RadC [Thermotogota bacterium]NLH18928.1 DNA repair protein RadC [Thermotogaceae bacterium]OQC31137.1 MAG: hypothetical protein BWX67_01301 [Thermotogota bacterium ADurb.Bin062]HNW46410.1 DNA repair protein RadC [Thermotogota bacterium]HNY81796.1 DNA repair protein RadC [Thermotogota bacterium]
MMPREKLEKYGPGELTNAELLAILLRTGTKERGVTVLAEACMEKYGGSLYALERETLEGLSQLKGIGEVKAITIKSALELGVRYYKERLLQRTKITEPEDVFVFCLEMSMLDQEHVRVLSLDSKNRVIGLDDVTKGTVNASLIHPREVFRKAILNSAVAIILVHNHPSGDPYPSEEDRKITEKITQSGELLSIPCRDHVIIGRGSFFSFTAGRTFLKGDIENGREPRAAEVAEVKRSP